mgnify:CR=1 FL=1
MSAKRLLDAYYAGEFGDEGQPPEPEPLNRRFNWQPPEGSPPSERPEIEPDMADEPVQSRLTPEQLRSLFRNARVAPGQTSPGPPLGGAERGYSLKELIPDEELMKPDDVLDVHAASKVAKTRKGRLNLSKQSNRMAKGLGPFEQRNRQEPTAQQIVDELLNTHPSELGVSEEEEGGDGEEGDEDGEKGGKGSKKLSFLARFKKK